MYLSYYNMTMSEIEKYLASFGDFGIKEQEAKIYLACLRLGQALVSDIAEEAEVQRTFAYDILSSLRERGLVSAIEVKGKKTYSAISIGQFKKMQQEKFRKFESLIPELRSLEKTVTDRPRVLFFEGADGIKEALEDTLNQPEGSEILAYATAEGYYSSEPRYVNDYIKARAKQKIFSRCIAPDNPTNREYSKRDKEQLRQTLLVPDNKFLFTNEIDIYGNKVAIMALKSELLAVIIESESVANTQRAIFELAWLGAKNINPA